MEKIYSEGLFTDICIINRLKYKGKGRPKKTDYMPLSHAQKQVNTIINKYLDKKAKIFKEITP